MKLTFKIQSMAFVLLLVTGLFHFPSYSKSKTSDTLSEEQLRKLFSQVYQQSKTSGTKPSLQASEIPIHQFDTPSGIVTHPNFDYLPQPKGLELTPYEEYKMRVSQISAKYDSRPGWPDNVNSRDELINARQNFERYMNMSPDEYIETNRDFEMAKRRINMQSFLKTAQGKRYIEQASQAITSQEIVKAKKEAAKNWSSAAKEFFPKRATYSEKMLSLHEAISAFKNGNASGDQRSIVKAMIEKIRTDKMFTKSGKVVVSLDFESELQATVKGIHDYNRIYPKVQNFKSVFSLMSREQLQLIARLLQYEFPDALSRVNASHVDILNWNKATLQKHLGLLLSNIPDSKLESGIPRIIFATTNAIELESGILKYAHTLGAEAKQFLNTLSYHMQQTTHSRQFALASHMAKHGTKYLGGGFAAIAGLTTMSVSAAERDVPSETTSDHFSVSGDAAATNVGKVEESYGQFLNQQKTAE